MTSLYLLVKKVFGIPDDRLGEVVCAAIKITKGSTVDEETVKNYCNGNVSDVYCFLFDDVEQNMNRICISFYAVTDRQI